MEMIIVEYINSQARVMIRNILINMNSSNNATMITTSNFVVKQFKKCIAYKSRFNELVDDLNDNPPIDTAQWNVKLEEIKSTVDDLVTAFDPIIYKFNISKSPGLYMSINLIKCCYEIHTRMNSPIQSVDHIELFKVWLQQYVKTVKYGLYNTLSRQHFDLIHLQLIVMESLLANPLSTIRDILDEFTNFENAMSLLYRTLSHYHRVNGTLISDEVEACLDGISISVNSILLISDWTINRSIYIALTGDAEIITFNNILINAFNVVRRYMRSIVSVDHPEFEEVMEVELIVDLVEMIVDDREDQSVIDDSDDQFEYSVIDYSDDEDSINQSITIFDKLKLYLDEVVERDHQMHRLKMNNPCSWRFAPAA